MLSLNDGSRSEGTSPACSKPFLSGTCGAVSHSTEHSLLHDAVDWCGLGNLGPLSYQVRQGGGALRPLSKSKQTDRLKINSTNRGRPAAPAAAAAIGEYEMSYT